jgi:hypothetical protein
VTTVLAIFKKSKTRITSHRNSTKITKHSLIVLRISKERVILLQQTVKLQIIIKKI